MLITSRSAYQQASCLTDHQQGVSRDPRRTILKAGLALLQPADGASATRCASTGCPRIANGSTWPARTLACSPVPARAPACRPCATGSTANPKSGNQGSISRDGVVLAGDLQPGGGNPDADAPAEEILRSYLYRYLAAPSGSATALTSGSAFRAAPAYLFTSSISGRS